MTVLELLQEHASGFGQGSFRVERNRKDLIKELSVSSGIPEANLIEDFDSEEKALSRTYVKGPWSIHYNVFSDRVIFERILPTSAIERLVELKQKNIKLELRERIAALEPLYFENFVANLFRELPWIRSARITKRSHDGGIDLEGTYMDVRAKIELPLYGQVKRWGTKVDFPEMTKFLGALALKRMMHAIGIFVASNGFTNEATMASKESDHKVLLYDGDELIDLMIAHSVGVRSSQLEVVSPDEGFWSELIP